MSAPHDPAREPATRAARAEAEGARLLEVFREHRLSIRTMDAPLRLATGGAIACLLGAAVLVLLRGRGSDVSVGVTDGVLTSLSTPLFLATLVLLAVGFGYVLTGAVLSHRVSAILGVLAITALIGTETGVLGVAGLDVPLPSWARLTTRLLLGAIWVLALAALGYRRNRHGDAAEDRALRAALVLLYSALFGAYLAVLRVASPSVRGLDNYPLMVSILMGGIALLAYPILQIAATDFAEWGQLTGQSLHRGLRRGRLRRFADVLVPAAACVGLLVAGWLLMRGSLAHRLRNALIEVAFLAAIVLVFLLIGRALRLGRSDWPESASFAGLFVVVAISTWLIAPVAGWVSGAFDVTPAATITEHGEFTAAAQVQHVGGPAGSTLLIPVGWSATNSDPQINAYAYTDVKLGRLALVIAHESIGPASIQQVAGELGVAVDGEAHLDGPRTRIEVKPKPPFTDGVVWVQQPSDGQGQAYVFLAEAKTDEPEGAELAFEAIVSTFRPAGRPAAQLPAESEERTPAAVAEANSDRLIAVAVGIQVVLSLIALALLAGPGRRWSGQLRIMLSLFGVITVVTACYRADSLARVVLGPGRHWRVLTESGVLVAVGALGLAALLGARRARGAAWSTRLPNTLTGLAAGVLALRAVDILYAHALSASKVPAWAALILLVAIAWDVTMSGESMTNHASRLIPRSSRIFLFFGYVILLAAAIVFYSGQHVASSGAVVEEFFFEPEAITRAGLFLVALPVLLLLFLLRTFGASAHSPLPAEPVDPHPPAEPVGPHPRNALDSTARVPSQAVAAQTTEEAL